MRKKRIFSFICFLAPSLTGVCVFVLLPFADVVRRSFATVMTGRFAGVDNYRLVLTNQAFRLAAANTLRFLAIGIPLLVGIGLIAALAVSRLRNPHPVKSLYLFPMAMPTATVVIVWRLFFYRQDMTSLVSGFLWKNLGYTLVLWLAGLAGIPRELEEAARVDGAGSVRCFFYIKIPCLRGSLYTILILSFLNAFKIYREAYLAAGAYPPTDIYLLQHLFNNWYVNLELDKLAAATVLVAAGLTGVILMLNHLWKSD